MPHSTTPPKTPAPPAARKKYVPLEPEKPKTEAEIIEEIAAHKALAAMASMGKGKLGDSIYYKRVQAATVKPTKAGSANDFFRNAAKSGIKISSAPTATALNTPPTTPPTAFNIHAPSFVGGGPQGSSKMLIDGVTGDEVVFTYNRDGSVTISQSPAKVAVAAAVSVSVPVPAAAAAAETFQPPKSAAPQAVQSSARVSPPVPLLPTGSSTATATIPPHLVQGVTGTASSTPSASANVTLPSYIPPHFRRPGQPATQYPPPHLRGIRIAPPSPALASSPSESENAHLQGVVVSQPQQAQPAAEYLPPLHLQSVVTSSQPRPAQPSTQYVLPHLRRSASPPTQVTPPHLQGAVTSQPRTVQPSTNHYLPHLRRAESLKPPAQITPAQLRGAPHQPGAPARSEISPPVQVNHLTLPPHLRGISPTTLSPTATTTQIDNSTPSHNVAGITMAPTSYPSVRPMDPDQDAFIQWLGQKNAAKKAETTEKAAEKVTIKSEEPSKPVQVPQISPSKESVNSKLSQGSLYNLNDTDTFLSYIQTKPAPKNYGAPRRPSRSPKQNAADNGWQRPANAFDNPRWKLNGDTATNFETYIKSGATAPLATAAQNNTVYGSASVRAAKAQAARVVAPKSQLPYQKPTFNGVQRLGQSIKPSVQNAPAQKIENVKPAQVVVKVEHAATESGLNDVAPKKPAVHPNPTQVKANEWQGMPSMQSVAAMISSDINTVRPQDASNAPPLTQTALVLQTGFKTVDEIHRSDGRISSTGLGGVSSDCAQDPRHIQGNDPADQLTDWDGTWAPAPVNWETERTSFDDSFIPAYIKEWQQTLPGGLHSVDINSDKFTSGVYAINNVFFVDPVDHGPPTIPDTAENTKDQELKRLWQTADIEANNYMVAVEKKRKQEKRALKASNLRFREIASQEPEPNPFSPAIDMYIRPAEEKDAADIVAIYNWYISNTIIPEDQVPIGLEDGKWLIKQAKEDNLPFLVAVKGRQPTSLDAQGRPSLTNNVIMPAVESVIGFCFPERFNYGFASGWKGRSRGTVSLQLYVHQEHTRKGVGRNLLDRLIHCLNPGYAYKNGAAWINPSHEKLYESEGAGMFHQLLFQIPVEQKHDPNIDWLTKFLLKFLFKENSIKDLGGVDRPQRLKSVARSSTKGRTAHFLDLAIFRLEARQEGEFDPYM